MNANAFIHDVDYTAQTIEETFALMDEVVVHTNVYDCGKLSDITRLEVFQFIAFLAASDDTIKKEETDFINSYFGTDWTPQKLADYLMENGIHNEGFDKMVPLSLEVLVQADNVLNQGGQLRTKTISKTLIGLYRLLGNLFINSSPHPTNWETHDLAAYIDHLNHYVNQNFKKSPILEADEEITFLPQDTELKSNESEDVGIAAPKKEYDVAAVVSQKEADLSITIKKDEDSGIIAPKKS